MQFEMLSKSNMHNKLSECRKRSTEDTLNSIYDEPDLFTYFNLLPQIKNGFKVMVIMRGPPGCGKTHLSRLIIKKCFSEHLSEANYKDFIFSSDDFFTDNDFYNYNPSLLEDAHSQNIERVKEKAVSGWSPIIVDNTNIKIWEMLPYIETAVKNRYILQLLEPKTPWRNSASKLAKKNKHNVTVKKIQFMIEKFEKVDFSHLIKIIGDKKYFTSLPQLRKFPLLRASSEKKCEDSFSANASSHTQQDNTTTDTFITSWDSYNTSNPKGQRRNVRKNYDSVKDTLQEVKQKIEFDSNLTDEKRLKNKILSSSSIFSTIENCTQNAKEDLLVPHKIGCCNENENYSSMRKMFPNIKPSALWTFFVKYNGNIDTIVNNLLNENKYQNELFLNTNEPELDLNLYCKCENPLKNLNSHQYKQVPVSTMLSNTVEDQSMQINKEDKLETESVLSKKIDKCQFLQNNALTQEVSQDQLEKKHECEILEINLGKELIEQLKLHFQDDLDICKDFSKKLNLNVLMPKTMAKELYCLWLESVCNQTEFQHKRKLQEKAFINSLGSFKTEEPEVHEDSLDADFDSSNNKCDSRTLELDQKNMLQINLKYKIPNECGGTFHQQQFECNKEFSNSSENTSEYLRSKQNTSQEDLEEFSLLEEKKRLALTDFEKMRNYASHHSQLKAECYQKAKQALHNGRSPVANYYSQVAEFHKSKIDTNNHRAANCIVEVHNTISCNADLIDLHYLHVVEALEWLDIFIDKHIANLKGTSNTFKYLFIITGRGLHSAGGVSAIKTNVKIRLRERNLRWTELNPGLLKTKIFLGSKYTKNI